LLDEISRVSDRVVMLANGQVVLNDDLQEILDTHRRMVLRLPSDLSDQLQQALRSEGTAQSHVPAGSLMTSLPGMLSLSGGPAEWTVICNGQSEALLQLVRDKGGDVLENSGATFEEVFHARMSGQNSGATAKPSGS
jgi:ABC-type multidrug transport system ATPase subunit